MADRASQNLAEKTAAELRNERLRLSSAEAQVRELTERLKSLANAVAELETNSGNQSSSREQLQAAVAAATAELAAAQTTLDKRREEAQSKKTAYAVIPYEGPNRTTRRPIYIECTRDGIIIQPEGVKIVPGDLQGPNGPGNPLASTVRAVREYLLETSADPKSPEAEPYPLFLVRPDGIIAYYEAKEAMSSWANEIGYQVVDQDWPLAFPTVDPALRQRAQVALDEAHERYRWLASTTTAQRTTGTGPKTNYRLAPTGGGLIAENSGPLSNTYSADWATEAARGGNGSGGPSPGGFGGAGSANAIYGAPGTNDVSGIPSSARLGPPGSGGRGGSGTSGSSAYGPGQYGGTTGGGRGSSTTRGVSGGGPGGAGPGNTYAMLGTGQPGGTGGVSNGTGGTAGGQAGSASGGGMAGGVLSGGGLNGGTTGGGASGANGTGAGTAGSSGGQTGGTAGTAGAGSPGNGNPGGGSTFGGSTFGGGATGGANAGGGAGGSSGQSGASGGQTGSAGDPSSAEAQAAAQRQYGDLSRKQTPGSTAGEAPQPYYSGQDQSTPPKSLAETRGKDWAVLRNGRGSQAVSRPIRMVCEDRQIRILADAASEDGEHVVPFAPTTGDTIPELVAAVEKRVGKWGLAGKGLYWSPELVFDVDPAGSATLSRLANFAGRQRVDRASSRIAIRRRAGPVAGSADVADDRTDHAARSHADATAAIRTARRRFVV
ncbi:MAG: hypothetical protein QM811_09510 [Pirellulales bacterium]